MIRYHVGDVCKQCNHPMLLTTGDVGGQMSPGHLYMWISNGSYTHESFDSENEYMIKWVFLDDSAWIIKWQGLDKPKYMNKINK